MLRRLFENLLNEGNERELQREQLDTVENIFFFLKKKTNPRGRSLLESEKE